PVPGVRVRGGGGLMSERDDVPEQEREAPRPVPARGPRPGGHGSFGVPVEKPSDFKASARRLFGRLAPYRMLVGLSVLLTVCAVVLSTLGPRVLGRATDYVFAGLLGNRLGETFPAGTPPEEVAAILRTQGQDTYADMIE